MQALFLSLTTLSGLALAAPRKTDSTAAGPICPSPDTNICVNSTAAKLPATQVHDYTQYNVAKYKEWPSTQDFAGCRAKCEDDPGCKSFQLYFQGPGLTSSAFMCNLYNHTIASYQVDCNLDGAESGVTYFDKYCKPPTPLTKGESPMSPETDDFTGSCNGARSWNRDQYQIIRDVIKVEAPFVDQSLQDCSDACQQANECKSYLVSRVLLLWLFPLCTCPCKAADLVAVLQQDFAVLSSPEPRWGRSLRGRRLRSRKLSSVEPAGFQTNGARGQSCS